VSCLNAISAISEADDDEQAADFTVSEFSLLIVLVLVLVALILDVDGDDDIAVRQIKISNTVFTIHFIINIFSPTIYFKFSLQSY
jgi:hypothetical protein